MVCEKNQQERPRVRLRLTSTLCVRSGDVSGISSLELGCGKFDARGPTVCGTGCEQCLTEFDVWVEPRRALSVETTSRSPR